jgi:hypothetical protein
MHISIGSIGNVYAETRDRTGDLQIFSLTLSQLSYRGDCEGDVAHVAMGRGSST